MSADDNYYLALWDRGASRPHTCIWACGKSGRA